MNDKTTERDFSPKLLIEWGIHETEDCEHVVSCTYSGHSNNCIVEDVVFRAPDDGQLWMFQYEFAPLAGVNNIEDYEGFRGDPTITGFAVEPYEVKVTKYRKIQQADTPHQDAEQGDVVESVARQIIDACLDLVCRVLRHSPHNLDPRFRLTPHASPHK